MSDRKKGISKGPAVSICWSILEPCAGQTKEGSAAVRYVGSLSAEPGVPC